MELPPDAAAPATHAVLADGPLARPVHLQPCRVDDDVARLTGWNVANPDIQRALTSAHRRVVRERKVNIHQAHDRFAKPLGRPQTETEDGLDEQAALDGRVAPVLW
jgi:hypothetical protein